MYNMLYEFVIQNETLYGREIRACYYKYFKYV